MTQPSTTNEAESCWTVDFWLDPACPLTRHTARWIVRVAEQAPVRVHWRVMSLSVLNEHRDDDPEGDPDGYLWIPARVAAAVATEHGADALGEFYHALWTTPGGTEREWIGDPGRALRRAGLSADLAGAGFRTDYDAELRASHDAGVGLLDADIGTPVLAITTPEGDRRALFGPVLSAVPEPSESIRLWQTVLGLISVPTFREIKT